MAFELTPWRPFRDLPTLQDEMDKLFDSFLRESMEPFRREWGPSLDVSETKNSVVVKADVPGIETKVKVE